MILAVIPSAGLGGLVSRVRDALLVLQYEPIFWRLRCRGRGLA